MGRTQGILLSSRWSTFLMKAGVRSVVALVFLAGLGPCAAAGETSECELWTHGIGNGFQPGAESLGLELGADYGLRVLGSRDSHDLALASLAYGHMLSRVVGDNHWYRGNWEGRIELFGGSQYSPEDDWLVGLTPHLRYDLATGSRWIPFIDGGAGVAATQIGPPDLSNTFEFNLQAGFGIHCFVRYNLAVTAEAKYLHMSDAGMTQPNFGVNGVAGLIGMTWFF